MIEAREVKKNTQSERTHQADKKKNAAYWDAIDGIIVNAITEIAKYSDEEIDSDELEDAIYDGTLGEVRDLIISSLENRGGVFPFVKEDL